MSRSGDSSAPGITRRAVLRGAGATLALPFLESLLPARAPIPPPPVRMAFLFMPNGVFAPAWTPKAEGADYELTPTLEPLARVRSKVLVLSGLWNANSREGDGHYAKLAPLLTGCKIRKTGGREILNGVSVDQLAAARLGHLTPLPSIELGTEPVRTVEDIGYSSVYGAHISWRSATQPAAKEIVPRLAFDRMFRSTRLRQEGRGRSVLDVVAEDARGLAARLDARDRSKLSEYQDAVREIERRIESAAASPVAGQELEAGAAPEPGAPADFQTHVRLMLDLLLLAFRHDITRVATFMFNNGVSGRDFSFLEGVKGGHHDSSHHENNAEKQRQYQLINRWHVAEFARFVEALEEAQDFNGPMLDNSMILLGAAMRDGNSHDPHDLPILLAGKGGGSIESGRHLRFPKDSPLCNLYASMLSRFGCPVDSFSDSTGPLI